MQLEIDAAAPNSENISVDELVKESGVVVIRNAFSKKKLARLFHNIAEYMNTVLFFDKEGKIPSFPRDYDYIPNAFASNLVALDPGTNDSAVGAIAKSRHDLLQETELLKNIQNCSVWPNIQKVITEDAKYIGGRVRIVHHEGGDPKSLRGAISLHQEKWSLRNTGEPNGHNIWVFLNPGEGVANDNAPGIQYVLGNRTKWTQPLPSNSEDYSTATRAEILRLSGFCRRTSNETSELIEVKGHTIFRPKIAVGDIILFDHHIPHGSFVPALASNPRVSCEFRIVPRA